MKENSCYRNMSQHNLHGDLKWYFSKGELFENKPFLKKKRHNIDLHYKNQHFKNIQLEIPRNLFCNTLFVHHPNMIYNQIYAKEKTQQRMLFSKLKIYVSETIRSFTLVQLNI
jgi:hypothetical protein